MRSILDEVQDYRAGRDDVDAMGHVLGSKPKAVQDLWLEEARYDDENRREYYELFGPDKYRDAIEADIVEIFESGLTTGQIGTAPKPNRGKDISTLCD